MAARGLTSKVWKVWRQDTGARGQRLFWYIETPYDSLDVFTSVIREKRLLRLDSLTTERDGDLLVVTGRRPVAITISAVHYIEAPLDAHFVEYEN